MSAGIISRGPAATGDYISFSILLLVSLSLLLIVSFSSKCCFNSRYILDRVIFLFINHFSALSFKYVEWIHHMTCKMKICCWKFSFRKQLRQIFPAVELNIKWGKLKFKVSRKIHIFKLFHTILSKILVILEYHKTQLCTQHCL